MILSNPKTRRHQKVRVILTCFCLVAAYRSLGQAEKSFSFYGAMQVWGRYTELNPGSTVGMNEFDQTIDFSVRRYRVGVKGTTGAKISYNLQFGNNNLSRYQKDQPPKVLDAYVSYHYTPDHSFTVGKHAWTGLSRYAAPSTFSAMAADIHYAATPGLNVHDDFFRRLAVAMTGQFSSLDYRIVLSKPFVYQSPPLSARAVFTDEPSSINFSGYFKYQLLNNESHGSSAFSPATYLGKKEIFNVGAGWTYQVAATQSLSASSDTLSHPMRSFAVDVFYEKPMGKNVWTLYTAYLHHDLGPNFVRYIGANNPANGGTQQLSLNGRGNSFPETGTGSVMVGQLGFYREIGQHPIQPNVTVQFGQFEALEDPMLLWEGGINYYLNEQNSKISITYQNRPVFMDAGSGAKVTERLDMLVFQYQVKFK